MLELDTFSIENESDFGRLRVLRILEKLVDEMGVVRIEVRQQTLDAIFKVVLSICFDPFFAFFR